MWLSRSITWDTLNDSFYKPLIDCGVRPDVIDAKQPLDAYKLIVSPLMMTIQEGDLPARIMQWVKDGGTWIAGPLTDVRNEIGARFKDRPLGILEELTGAHWDYSVPDIDGHMSAHWQDGSAFGSRLWGMSCTTKRTPTYLARDCPAQRA